MTTPGIQVRSSKFSVSDTMDRLQSFLTKQGATIYARINQEAEVARVGEQLYPLEFLLFGNPKAGGPLMKSNPLIALDLPLKIIAWQDEKKDVWLAYNDGAYIEKRHALANASTPVLYLDQLIEKALG